MKISNVIDRPFKVVMQFIFIISILDSNVRYTFCLLYKALVRPHVEYAHSVWYPYKKCDITDIEKVQKRATKLIISLKNCSYKERLKILNLLTLKYRRLRGDMIDVFKIAIITCIV